LASSSSTALLAPSSIKLAVNAVLRRTQHREVLEGARRLQLLNRRRPRLHLIGLVDRALHRDAHTGHLSPTHRWPPRKCDLCLGRERNTPAVALDDASASNGNGALTTPLLVVVRREVARCE